MIFQRSVFLLTVFFYELRSEPMICGGDQLLNLYHRPPCAIVETAVGSQSVFVYTGMNVF